jgi:hypothetical protein
MVLGFAPSALAAPVSHLAINSVSLTEGDAGTSTLTFTISYTGTKNNISVDWATANGTATAGADYVAASGTATFTLAGAMSQTIAIPVDGDLLDETNETFTVNLTNAQPPAIADITTPTGTGTINDNDPTPSIVINDVSLTEGNAGTSNANFAVTLSAPSGRNVTVNYTTANGTAVQPGDYTTTSGTITFLPGQVVKTVPVPIVGDLTDEPNETYVVNLSGATNATIADNQGAGTIVNDDTAPSLTINDVSLTEGNAGTANMTFTATLSAASGKTVTVSYATADGTATAPADYTSSAGTLTFNPGILTRTFTVPIVGDTRDEFDETFVVNLSSPVNATIADSQGVGTIVDNDPTPGLVINNVTVIEVDAGTVTATFTATLSAASNKVVTVDYATSDVTATAPADYTAASGTLTFSPGVTTRTVPIAVQGDLLNEASETYRVTLSNPVNATITTATGTGTITDNDPLPSIVINDVSQTEGNAGTTNANFTVTLSAPSGRNVTVNYATANSTAVRPGDYTATSGTLTFTPGQVTKTMSVPVVGDVLDEIDEAFFVNLSAATNATIADNQGIGTILDDDPPPSLTINDVSLTEGNAGTANMTFTATLSAVSSKTVTVAYATADGTATAPTDYALSVGTLTFNPGVVTRTFTVPVVGDTVDEFDETFFANLSSPVNATIADNQGVGTIVDNDPTPSVGINNVSTPEGDAGTTTATFTVSLSAASGKPITVDYASADGTAIAPGDYTGVSGTLSFAPGQTTKTVDVAVQGDLLDEFDETFAVNLSNLTNVAPGILTSTGTILDDDPTPTVSVGDVSVVEGDAGATNATFTVALSAPSGKPISVDYASSDGTAKSPGDYAGASSTLSFAPGQTTKTVDVTVSGDATYENDETFGFSLSNLVNVAPGAMTATGTVNNDDGLPQASIDDRSVSEGDAGTVAATFTVSLTNPSAFPISVDVSTTDQTATTPADYGAVSTTVSFAPGQVSTAVDVLVEGDTVHELDETYAVDLSNPTGAALADAQGVGTIVDDDVAPVLDVGDVTVTEGDVGDVTASFPVTLTGATQVPVTVDVATADGTSTAPGDYAALTTSLTFSPGQTAKTVDVTVHGDTTFELDETFTLQLSDPAGATIGVDHGIGTIVNDDSTPGLAVTDVSLPEGDTGDSVATFTVSLAAPSAFPISVDVATTDGTATQASDYDPVATTTLTFAPGETTKTVDVTIHGDTTVEPDETFTVQLSNLVGAGITDGVGIGTIVDDDAVPAPPSDGPVASIGDASALEGGAGTGTTLSFPVSLSKASGGAVTVVYRTSDRSATAGSDYVGAVGSVRIPAGETTASVPVTVIGDDLIEPDETLAVEITDVFGATMGSAGTGTILNDDREITHLILRAKGRHHHVLSRGRMLHAEPGMRVRVVLLRRTGNGFVPIARSTVRVHVRDRGSVRTGIFTKRFSHQRFGRYVVRAIFRGDATHTSSHARARVRL